MRQTQSISIKLIACISECRHKSEATWSYSISRAFIKKRERMNVHECLRVKVASWKICLFVTALFLWQRLSRRGAESYKLLCAYRTLSVLWSALDSCFKADITQHTDPPGQLKAHTEWDTLSQLYCRRDTQEERNGKMGNKATSKTTFSDYT